VEGTPFGRYQLTELLGRGEMGKVWRAHDTAIDRTERPPNFVDEQVTNGECHRVLCRVDRPGSGNVARRMHCRWSHEFLQLRACLMTTRSF
jgi:hypothetical protein